MSSSPVPCAGSTDFYSRAMRANGFIFVSGQIPKDVDAPLEKQVEQAIANVREVLEGCGSSLSRVVRVGVYLTDLKNGFAIMNSVYTQHFQAPRPARTTIEVAGLPGGFQVEIDAVALE